MADILEASGGHPGGDEAAAVVRRGAGAVEDGQGEAADASCVVGGKVATGEAGDKLGRGAGAIEDGQGQAADARGLEGGEVAAGEAGDKVRRSLGAEAKGGECAAVGEAVPGEDFFGPYHYSKFLKLKCLVIIFRLNFVLIFMFRNLE